LIFGEIPQNLDATGIVVEFAGQQLAASGGRRPLN
jgi:hypothetical protein